jgi:hypothetical protein
MTPDPQEYVDQLSEGRKPPAVGPSDSSDTAVDLIGAPLSSDALGAVGSSDRNGTGERFGTEPQDSTDAADIGFDRVVEKREAGLGGGLDKHGGLILTPPASSALAVPPRAGWAHRAQYHPP